MTLKFNNRLSITPVEEGGGQPAVEDIKYTDFSSSAAMTLADGIIYRNNTSGTGYIDTGYNVAFTPEQWQKELIIQAHIKTPSSFNDHGHWILGSTSGAWNTGIGLTINKDAGYTFWFMLGQSETTLSVDFSGTTVPQLNKEYWVRLYKPNTETESHDTLFQISTDGINWTTEASRTIANIASNYTTSGYLRLFNGYWGDIYNQFEGGIYFDKDTFISVDGEKVWYLMDSACEALKNQNKTITVNGTYTADTGYTGLGTVNVNVTPRLGAVNIPATTSAQTVKASPNFDGFYKVTVPAVTSSIDSNIRSTNIKSGVRILGVTGVLTTLNGQSKTITQNGTYYPDSGYNAFTSVSVNVAGGGSDVSIESVIGQTCATVYADLTIQEVEGMQQPIVNCSIDDSSSDIMYKITGKHFVENRFDSTLGSTWTSDDGELTLNVDWGSILPNVHTDDGGNTVVTYPTVFATYGYYENWGTGESEHMIILSSNDTSRGSGIVFGSGELNFNGYGSGTE